MRAEFFEFLPEFKLWLAANHKPVIRGTDLAIWRRVKLVPFNVTIPERKRDPDLPARLRDELAGVLAWAIEGCRSWQSEGLGTCEAVEASTAAYRTDMDVLGDFVRDRCVLGATEEVRKKDLYQAYVKWCDDTGERPMAHRTFSRRLRDREEGGWGNDAERAANTVGTASALPVLLCGRRPVDDPSYRSDRHFGFLP